MFSPAAGIIAPHPVEVARTHVLQVVNGQVVSRMLFIPASQLLPTGQGTPPPEASGKETGQGGRHAHGDAS